MSHQFRSTLHAAGAVKAGILIALLLLPLFALRAQDGEEGGGEQSLIEAYQREFAFLDNEIRLLRNRLSEVRENGEDRLGNARGRLEGLESRLIELRRQVDRRQEDLRLLEDESAEVRSSDDIINRVIEQAGQRLAGFDVPPFGESVASDAAVTEEEERKSAELEYLFNRSFETLRRASTVHTEEGEFFLQDGRSVTGEIVNIGRIAAFGVSETSGGTLAPAGDGFLRLVDTDTAQTARRLSSSEGAEGAAELPLYMFDSRSEPAEIDDGTSFRETVEAAGVIGLVIIGIGIVAALLIVVRLVLLVTAARGSRHGGAQVAELVDSGDLEGARTKAASLPGAIGPVLESTVTALQSGTEGIEDVISESVLNEQPRLDRFRSALGVFAAVAPLLGLLGTVTGMIATFDVITQFGTGDPKLLSGGISEALITTEFGLAVAIPTLLIGNLLSSWSDRITSNLEVSALRLVNITSGYRSSSIEEEVVS